MAFKYAKNTKVYHRTDSGKLYDCNFEWFRQAKKVEKNNA
ncbi:hypothetical protein AU106_gp155 [Sinorhizobium phage phiM9]|uniref:Uncharacterized protein n=1 Tax=Sinorhizobium phage phiM9 TaxID=1636182 RepID=A0A0F6TGP1_9CAUD|nr:hypothetical protein AU106_gp155 [Sinorhizobium phage phiM9]AKE44786.1 hypothetical protein Sm_phiM9_158 [Sinorhizobium phage phiM9]